MSAPSHSTYHALQAKLQRRFSRGFTLLGSFAYGRSIDNGSGVRTTDGDSLTPSNNYDLRLERGLSAFDFRRRLTTSWLWDLPLGANTLLRGWQLGGILTMQDGFPFTVLCGPGNIQNGGGACYPDATGANPNLARNQQTRTHFFNIDALTSFVPSPRRLENVVENVRI